MTYANAAMDRPRSWNAFGLLLWLVAGVGCDTSLPNNDDLKCTSDEDCELGEVCTIGQCVPGCRVVEDRCPPGSTCMEGICCPEIDAAPPPDAAVNDAPPGPDAPPAACPDDMVSVDDMYCIDRYEASRPNATSTWSGDDDTRATSRPDVIPWYPVTLEVARTACICAGKRMCTPDEVTTTCQGPDQTVYAYGNDFDPVICNSIDTYCRCGAGQTCDGITPCPYPHCYNQPPAGETSPSGGCGAMPHVMPTGSFPDCTNEYGAYDLNGNVWEMVDNGTTSGEFRGGAYNCIDSERLHKCDFAATNISAKGFRCCADVAGSK